MVSFILDVFHLVVEFFFTSTLQYISPTCGKLIRYATLLRLLVLFHFVFPAIQYFVNMTHFTYFQSKWKRGRAGKGIEYAIVRSFGGKRLYSVTFTLLH